MYLLGGQQPASRVKLEVSGVTCEVESPNLLQKLASAGGT
jgi:hypothetical protein